jgi:hypothetical protein
MVVAITKTDADDFCRRHSSRRAEYRGLIGFRAANRGVTSPFGRGAAARSRPVRLDRGTRKVAQENIISQFLERVVAWPAPISPDGGPCIVIDDVTFTRSP